MFAAKFAVLLQIKKLFTAYQRDFVYWSVQSLIVGNLIAYLVDFFGAIFSCWPRQKIWDPTVPGKCIYMDGGLILTGVIKLVSDVTILALPVCVIARLNMRLSDKLSSIAIFATGIL